MGKSKCNKVQRSLNPTKMPETESEIRIADIPEKLLRMRVNSGTKIRNVVGYALKEFPNYDCVVWSATGGGIGKGISCAEIFKRKHEKIHQITKLRYVKSEKTKSQSEDNKTAVPSRVPQILIYQLRKVNDTSQPGYQAPGDRGEFSSDQATTSKKGTRPEGGSNVTCIDAEEFAAMGLRTGQKRPKKEQQVDAPPRKNKKKGDWNR